MRDRIGPVVAIAGMMFAAVASFVLPRTHVPTPAERFLEAWERSRLTTYVVEWDVTRRTADGKELSYPSSLAQRPPDDRLLIGFGSVEGRIGGNIVRCGTDPDGITRCFPGPPARPYAEEVDAELDRLRDYVTGDIHLYDVTATAATPGCFQLRLGIAFPTPPYGERATFCFDDVTGARVRTVIERPEAIDTTESVGVRSTVTDEDFSLPDE